MDHHATTPLDPQVLKSMMPYFVEKYGNASSIDHSYGYDASIAVENARDQISSLIGSKRDEIVFTSGATESNNMALTGTMNSHKDHGNHLITCTTEHKAILDTARYLEELGNKITYLHVDKYGQIDMNHLKESITTNTVLISIMVANNEVGTIQDITTIGKIAHEKNILFHTDAAQAVGHIPINVDEMNIDMMSISSHKMYGPKGVGALYVRSIKPRVNLKPILYGGGQEKNMRSGTLNVPGIVGFGAASLLAQKNMHVENKRFLIWTEKIIEKLSHYGAIFNGHPSKKLVHNLSFYFPGIDGKAIINSLSKDIAISAGSACTTQTVEPSHVLLAMGLDVKSTHSSVRIGLGRFNTENEIDYFISKIIGVINMLKNMEY